MIHLFNSWAHEKEDINFNLSQKRQYMGEFWRIKLCNLIIISKKTNIKVTLDNFLSSPCAFFASITTQSVAKKGVELYILNEFS